MGRTIQLKAICTLDLNSVVVAILQRQECTAGLVGGHGIHKAIVRTADLELHIGDALGLLVCIDLDDLHSADGIVVEIQRLRVIGVHHNSLAAGFLVDGVARDALHLSRHDGAGDAGNLDLAVFICPVQTVGGKLSAICINHTTISIGDLELNAFQRLLGHGILLVDDETALGLVAELQSDRLTGLDAGSLRRIIQNVGIVLGTGFLDN